MGDEPDRTGGQGAAPKVDAAKQERLAQALRANLKRRKAQIRGRVVREQLEPASGTD